MTRRAALVAACSALVSSVACGTNDANRSHDAGFARVVDAAADVRVLSDARVVPDAHVADARAVSDGRVAFDAASVFDATMPVDASSPAVCDDDAAGLPRNVPCILQIDGRAIDGDGAAIAPRTLVSACGPSQCSPGYTSDSGAFAIPVGFHLEPSAYSVELHVRPDRAGFYYALPRDAGGPDVEVGALRVLDMPAHGPALNVVRAGAPAQVVSSGDVTLEVPDGVYVRLDVESNLAGDHGKEFRVLAIARNFVQDFADASLGIEAMYAMEPFESSFEYPGATPTPVSVTLSFANAAGFAPGSKLDVLALGTYIYPDWLTPAAFEKVASAHVTADGSRVELDAGEGLLHLTWVALRRAS